MSPNEIQSLLGNMDIYLLDQILKGRIQPGMKILDAGCGEGRNLDYFMKTYGFEVYGIDMNKDMVEYIRLRAKKLNPQINYDHFRHESADKISFADNFFDLVISNAVLHFAKNEAQWQAMILEMWRVLKPKGIFFCRLATSIGIENRIQQIEDRHYLLPDGTNRFLADETMLLRMTHRLGARFLEPIKTVNVQNSRCMTTWVLTKEQ
jgi:ubiquinone/menaquinone biosynthesis C-methylase UbiE